MRQDLNDRERHEQSLMRIGRKLQSLGQLLDQAPSHLVIKGDSADPAIAGPRPVQIDLDEMRDLFSPDSPHGVAQVLRSYHELLQKLRGEDKPEP
jgi:hypothetical protein